MSSIKKKMNQDQEIQRAKLLQSKEESYLINVKPHANIQFKGVRFLLKCLLADEMTMLIAHLDNNDL